MARLKGMTQDCCKECKHLTMDGSCRSNFKTCNQWRVWFRHEWAVIHRVAENAKKKRRERRDRTRRSSS